MASEITVGTAVRSWDSQYPERQTTDHNWIDGVVIAVGPVAEFGDGCPRYSILVIADYFQGKPVTGEHSRVGTVVNPPVNGSVGMFSGEEAQGVIPFPRKDENPEINLKDAMIL